ncbi:hypothetical protein KKKH31_01450 [Helicobacter pylori]
MAVRFDDNSMVVGSEEMENADNGNECFMPVISSEKDSKMFFSKLSGLLSIFFTKDSSYNINPNLKSYLKDSRYPKNFSYASHLFFTNNDNVFEFEYDLKEEYKQCLIELVPIKYNNNLSYSTKEENQFKKEGLTPLILKAFEHNHINVKHKHREKELEILFFENKQELYNSVN